MKKVVVLGYGHVGCIASSELIDQVKSKQFAMVIGSGNKRGSKKSDRKRDRANRGD